MAVAKQISRVESLALDWLEIEDEDGAKYRYIKRGDALDMSIRPVVKVSDGGATLVCDDTGQVLLRQDGPGLPTKIVVEHSDLIGRKPGRPVLSEWNYRIEYEQE